MCIPTGGVFVILFLDGTRSLDSDKAYHGRRMWIHL